MEITPTMVLVAIVGAPGYVLAVDKALGALSVAGRWPTRFRRFDVARAERIVEAERERTALARLADNSEAILAAVAILKPNGGSGLPDAVGRVEAKVDALAGQMEREVLPRLEAGTAHFARLDERDDEQDRRLEKIEALRE